MNTANYKCAALVVIDGMGVAPLGEGNAITNAHTPNLDRFWNEYPHTTLEASGKWAGLSNGKASDGVIGHRNMGAGRILMTPKAQIEKAIQDETFYQNPEIIATFQHVKNFRSNVHVVASFDSDEHFADLDHFAALLDIAVKQELNRDNFFVHILGVGRENMINLIGATNNACVDRRMGRVASVIGGKYALNNHRDWDFTEVAYRALVEQKAHVVLDYQNHIKKAYRRGQTDYELEPFYVMINEADKPHPILSNDAVIFLDFNGEQLTQLVTTLNDPLFNAFQRPRIVQNLQILGLSDYGKNLPINVAFPTLEVENHLSKVLSDNRCRQVKISEIDKFAQITYFFNQGAKKPFPGELQIEIPPTETDDSSLQQKLITEVLLTKLHNGYKFGMVNYNGPDKFAHQGDQAAATRAMEVIDEQLGIIADAILELDGCMIVTSDHGNAEMMIDPITGAVHTQHTINPVPFLAVGRHLIAGDLQSGTLADVAPTVLSLLGIDIPPDMTGHNLLLL